MTEKTKKILFIILFAFSVIILGVILYLMFFAPAKQPGIEINAVNNAAGGLPVAGTGQIGNAPITPGGGVAQGLPEADEVARGGLTKTTVLTTSAVFDTTLSESGEAINYYDKSDGRFYSITSDGSVERLSNKQFPDAENVAWNVNGSEAVIEFPDGSNIVYDFTAETQVTLPKHWEDFEFSDNNDHIFAKSIGLDPSNRAIVISNDDGSQVKAVQALGENADKVDINPDPDDQVIAFSRTGEGQSSFTTQVIIPIGQNQENFHGLTVDGLGFEAKWSPRGDYILYSSYGPASNYKPMLWSVNGTVKAMGDERISLGIYTWANKCVFGDNKTAYCAVPQKLDDNAGFQPTLGESLPDDLYKIDITSGRPTLLARPATDTSMKNLQISDNNSILYYTNSLSGRLEFIKLK